MDSTPGAVAIAQERKRQIESEGWTSDHDDHHAPGTLACAGGAYAFAAFHDAHVRPNGTPSGWPFDADWFKRTNARTMLIKAGALIAAEIDRIDRADGGKIKDAK